MLLRPHNLQNKKREILWFSTTPNCFFDTRLEKEIIYKNDGNGIK